MAQKNKKNPLKSLSQKLNSIDLNAFLASLKGLKIEDLKNINYKRLFYDLRRSKYTKPTLGIFSASLLAIFVLVPKFELIISTQRKLKQYKTESRNLPIKLSDLKIEKQEFEEIEAIMTDVNSSFLRNEQIVFITKLLNEAAKKSNIKINYFSPMLNADSSKLCKQSTIQKKSKKFKSKKNNQNLSKKGSLQEKYYEVNFSSDYLDIIKFLEVIQEYNVTLVPYCLEVESELDLSTNIPKANNRNDSIVIPLNELGDPIYSDYEIRDISNSTNLGKVLTRIIFKIPSFSR